MTAIGSASMDNFCQSAIARSVPLVGDVSLVIRAAGRDGVQARDLVVNITDLTGSLSFQGADLGIDASHLSKGPVGVVGAPGAFGQQADRFVLDNLHATASRTTASTLTFTGASLVVHAGHSECFCPVTHYPARTPLAQLSGGGTRGAGAINSDDSPAGAPPGSAWQRFGRWRRRRPFWAGVLLLGSGSVILAPPYATLRLGDLAVSVGAPGGVSALLLGVMLIVLGISVWVRPQFRVPAGIAAGLLALVSLPTSNLGGLIIGMLLGLAGAALAISWTDHPGTHRDKTTDHHPPQETR